MKIMLQYGITNHICKLLHLYQTIREIITELKFAYIGA